MTEQEREEHRSKMRAAKNDRAGAIRSESTAHEGASQERGMTFPTNRHHAVYGPWPYH